MRNLHQRRGGKLAGSWFESWKALLERQAHGLFFQRNTPFHSVPTSADALPCAEISAGAEESARLTHRDFWQNQSVTHKGLIS